MSSGGQVPGCLKYGCMGCLSTLALGVVLVFLLTAIHLSSEPADPRPEEARAEHRLPARPNDDRPAVGEVLPLPETPGSASGVGRVILDLEMGEFRIRPGPAGEPIRIEADYDASAFELAEEFSGTGDGAWTYRVSFGGKRGRLGMLFGAGRHNVDNRVEIVVPRGHPVDLVGRVGLGELEADLGGLRIRHVDLELGAGDHFVEFRDPLPQPMETFRLDGSFGNLEVRSLGDASPRRVEIDHGAGEVFLDLKGAWSADAEVDVDFGIGTCRLWLPDDARVDIRRARVALGESSVEPPRSRPLPEDAPTLKVTLTGNLGELAVEY